MVVFRVVFGELKQAIGDLIVRKIGEIVVIFVDFDDLIQTAFFKSQGLGQHFIDSGAANNREMTDIIVISLE